MNNLIAYLAAIRPVSLMATDYLRDTLKTRYLDRREYLISPRDVCDKIFFVNSGLLYRYQMVRGSERVLGFMQENELVYTVPGFCEPLPSHDTVRALEPTELFYLTRDQVQSLANEFSEFRYISRYTSEHLHGLTQKHRDILQMTRQEDRFRFVLKHSSGLLHRVPNRLMASWLGCSPETLSRMKAKQWQ